MTANAPQRVDVARYAGLCVKVRTPSDTDLVLWTDYAALLQQVAELEHYKRLSDEANGTLKIMCAAAESKLAERNAEIVRLEAARASWQALANATINEKQDAERAREEADAKADDARNRLEMACGLLQEVQPLTSVAPRFHYTRNRIAAFLAANGGG